MQTMQNAIHGRMNIEVNKYTAQKKTKAKAMSER